jgi:hypothetical protein
MDAGLSAALLQDLRLVTNHALGPGVVIVRQDQLVKGARGAR